MRRIVFLLLFMLCCTTVYAQEQLSITFVNGHAQWSVVCLDDRSTDILKRLALLRVSHPVMMDDAVCGEVVHIGIEDKLVPSLSIGTEEVSANVLYEFRPGRYRVTVSNITLSSSTGGDRNYYSLAPMLFTPKGKYHGAYKSTIAYLDSIFYQMFKLGSYSDDW